MNKRKLIEAIENGEPRVHATGFAQLYVEPDKRLHVWTDWLLEHAPDITQIVFYHDHRYEIRSKVLSGSLHDQMVEPVVTGPLGEWGMWEVRPSHEGDPEKPHRDPRMNYYDVKLLMPRIIKAGNDYTIPLGAFHATRAIGDTVTVMKKINEEARWARLLVPYPYDPIHSLTKQPSQKDIKREMIRAVANL